MIENRIGVAIRTKREEFGYSQEELAEAIGKTSSFIGQIERGDALPSVKTLARLTQILAIDANNYFYDCNDRISENRIYNLMLSQLTPEMRELALEIIRQFCKFGR